MPTMKNLADLQDASYVSSDLLKNTSYVKKRDGTFQEMDFAKIQNRLKYLSQGYLSIKDRSSCESEHLERNDIEFKGHRLERLNFINISTITKKVVEAIVDKISTNEIDEVAARICAEMSDMHLDYGEMSSRIIISNHHKNTRMRHFFRNNRIFISSF